MDDRHSHIRPAKLHMTCWNIQTLDVIASDVEMLVRNRGRGRGRDEDVGRGCIESWWELKVRATEIDRVVYRNRVTEFDRFDIDRSTDEGGLDARANRVEGYRWDRLAKERTDPTFRLRID